jgi:hypothetical protein
MEWRKLGTVGFADGRMRFRNKDIDRRKVLSVA